MNLYMTGLTNAESTIGSLVLDSRIPPAIEMKDMISGSKIQTGTACFQGKEEDAAAISKIRRLVLEGLESYAPALL